MAADKSKKVKGGKQRRWEEEKASTEDISLSLSSSSCDVIVTVPDVVSDPSALGVPTHINNEPKNGVSSGGNSKWVDLFRQNRTRAPGCDLSYISSARRDKLGFACILVDMRIAGNFPDSIILEDEFGVQFTQNVMYEWKPIPCSVCKQFGHDKHLCPSALSKSKQVWKEKVKHPVIAAATNPVATNVVASVISNSACEIVAMSISSAKMAAVKGKAALPTVALSSNCESGSTLTSKNDVIVSARLTGSTPVIIPPFTGVIGEGVSFGMSGDRCLINSDWLDVFPGSDYELLAKELPVLNRVEFSDVSVRVANCKASLDHLQSNLHQAPLDQDLLDQERALVIHYRSLKFCEESYFKQKARADWLKLDGSMCSDHSTISRAMIDFYEDLLGVESHARVHSDSSIWQAGKLLSSEQATYLCRPVSYDEVKSTLMGMGSNKAPGVDGFNAYFFKKEWDTVGPSVFAAIDEFFRTGCLLNVTDHIKAEIMTMLNFKEGSLPVTFLGIPLISSGSNWLCRDFLWHGNSNSKSRPVAWHDVWLPKKEGGLRLKSLSIWNCATVGKNIWFLLTSYESLWDAWIRANKLRTLSYWGIIKPPDASWCWRKLLDLRSMCKGLFSYCLGSGMHFKFWTDPWLRDVWHDNHRHFIDSDIISWKLTTSGIYSIASAYEYFWPKKPVVTWYNLIWGSSHVPKCSFIAWLAIKGRLATRSRLLRWGVTSSDLCSLCEPLYAGIEKSVGFPGMLLLSPNALRFVELLSALLYIGFGESAMMCYRKSEDFSQGTCSNNIKVKLVDPI
ncbi:hypothetical protein ZIOFF_012668 [Zingiber officinale]|uniref:Reverse transcriptase zinc-binding domain-containing protein n=1 Tax=Zingiber officinale TaxID=94328 RepID=A0A8J5M3K4_ZINOF|nr:hypothetical protein ZIOFF_012668 [Zingiber officinale]